MHNYPPEVIFVLESLSFANEGRWGQREAGSQTGKTGEKRSGTSL